MSIPTETRAALVAEVRAVARAIGAGASPESCAACMLGVEWAPFLAAVRAVWPEVAP